MKQIYLNGLQIHDYSDSSLGMIVSPGIDGLDTPSIRLPSFDRPNVDGSVVPNQLYSGRLITLSGLVFADDVATYRARRLALEQAIAIRRDSNNNSQSLTLQMTTDDDKLVQVECYTKGFVFPDNNMMHGKFKIDLFSPSLYIVGQTLNNVDMFIFQGGGFAVATAIPFAMNVAGGALASIVNNGNVDSYPFYILRGPLENPVFTNVTTGEQFSLTYTLTAGQLIEIDTLNRTVVFRDFAGDTPVNIRNYFSGTFATLTPGTNQCKLSNADYSNTGLISIQYRDSYSGI